MLRNAALIATTLLVGGGVGYVFYSRKRKKSLNAIEKKTLQSKIRLIKTMKVQEVANTLLNSSHVYVDDPSHVFSTLTKMSEDGADVLQVISDFDYTTTMFSYNGIRQQSSHNVLESSSLLPDWYRNETIALRDKYYAIEIDSKMTREEKYPYMIEWWTKAHELLLKLQPTKSLLQSCVKQSNAKLRTRCNELFDMLSSASVPCLIFSAGIGDVIEELLIDRVTLHNNIKIVSNFLEYDPQEKMIGVSHPLIHTFNKCENSINNSSYFYQISERRNIFLMGDSLGDLGMSRGIKTINNIITVGFLNDNVDNLLPQFRKAYDIVIVRDETMNVPILLLDAILNNNISDSASVSAAPPHNITAQSSSASEPSSSEQ